MHPGGDENSSAGVAEEQLRPSERRRKTFWGGPTPSIVLAIVLVTFAALLAVVLIASRGGSGTRLDATKLTLELTYSSDEFPTVNLEGQPEAAPAGARIVCRREDDADFRIGDGVAGEDGSFDLPLDGRAFPDDVPTNDEFRTLNQSVECRADEGSWVQPLRPARISVN
jgi:hypothetical protein